MRSKREIIVGFSCVFPNGIIPDAHNGETHHFSCTLGAPGPEGFMATGHLP